MGNTYFLFYNIDDAKNARRNLCFRRFNDRLIRIIYYEEEKFDKKILKIMKKVLIILKVIMKKIKLMRVGLMKTTE